MMEKDQMPGAAGLCAPFFKASSRALAELFAGMACRCGRAHRMDDNARRTFAILLDALAAAESEGSVCLSRERLRGHAAMLSNRAAASLAKAPDPQDETSSPKAADADAASMAKEKLLDLAARIEAECMGAFPALFEILVESGLAVRFENKGKPAPAPLVFDKTRGSLFVYTERSFYDEWRLASRILRLAAAGESLPLAVDEESDRARRAVNLALAGRLAVISGGPGTGKTTIVTNVLAALLEQNADYRIALAAPTGKAAGRMQQAVHDRASSASSNPAVVERLQSLSASTIHRLLFAVQDDGSRPGPGSPLNVDILVVDESSMIDMGLAIRLFDAVDLARTRVVLLGDRHQLAAVGPGSVFADLSDQKGALRACITELVVSHRFAADKAVGVLSSLINAADAPRVLETLSALNARARERAGVLEDNPVRWHEEKSNALGGSLTPAARAWLDAMMHDILHAVRACAPALEGTDELARKRAAADLSRVMRSFGVLAAARRGPMSVEAVNRFADAMLVRAGFSGSRWRQIIVRANDPVLELYNGDVGVVVPAAGGDGGDEVYFADAGRFVKAGLLPAYDPAFAITIHQSQGSEYHRVAVLMPERADSPLATRELLYTAITRVSDTKTADGRTRFGELDLFAGRAVIEACVRNPVQREGGLAERLAQALAAGVDADNG